MTRTTSLAILALIVPFIPAMADTVSENEDAATIEADAPEAWRPEDGDVIDFTVLRKGKEFGTHRVTFSSNGEGGFTANSDVDLKARLGPITLFRYSLDAAETWKDGILVELKGSTNDDGDDEFVEASLDDGMLAVRGSEYEGNAPIGIVPSSHWNIQEVYSSQILSTESGELLDVKVTNLGQDTVKVAGETVSATRYRLVSDLTVDLWYDAQNRWVKLGFEARGQQIDYVLNRLY